MPRPLLASNVTAAVVFRAVEKWQPTLIIDEADTLLAGERGAARRAKQRPQAGRGLTLLRNVGDNHEPTPLLDVVSEMAVATDRQLPRRTLGRPVRSLSSCND